MYFDVFNTACGLDGRAKNKIPINVAAAGRNFVGRIGMKNQIRLAELPTGVEAWGRRQVGSVAFQHSVGNPSSKERNFIGRKMKIAGEIGCAGIGKPGGHDALFGEVRDLPGVRFDVAVGKKRKRSCFTGMMARSASAKDDRREIFIERDAFFFG